MKFKGSFDFYNNLSESKQISFYLSVKDGEIYTYGSDAVGSYILLGSVHLEEKKATFIQKYRDNYEIEYKCFFFSYQEIKGQWKTTNFRGNFTLNRVDYQVHEEISRTLQFFSDSQEEPFHREEDSQSILAVILKGSQGAVPSQVTRIFNQKEFQIIFNQMKKMGQVQTQDNFVRRKTTFVN